MMAEIFLSFILGDEHDCKIKLIPNYNVNNWRKTFWFFTSDLKVMCVWLSGSQQKLSWQRAICTRQGQKVFFIYIKTSVANTKASSGKAPKMLYNFWINHWVSHCIYIFIVTFFPSIFITYLKASSNLVVQSTQYTCF